MENATRLAQAEAEALGRELQRLASAQAGLDHDFCSLVARFDAGEAIGWFGGIKTTAHFLAFACSMSPAVAREHVRVARALRTMPATDALFAQGRLSYSKVRELTRLVGQVDEDGLLELALEMTASQLARTVSSFRTAAGTRIRAEAKRRFTVTPTGDGMVLLTVFLPAEDAALVTAAVEAASRRGETPAQRSAGSDAPAGVLVDVPAGTPRVDRVQALVDVAASYLDTLPGEPDDDHTLVIVQVAAEQIIGPLNLPAVPPDVPAGTSLPTDGPENVPAESFDPGRAAAGQGAQSAQNSQDAARRLRAGVCHVVGHGPIEAATAQRLVCTGRLLGAVVDGSGDVLALGRTARLATRAQRRALLVRDHGTCQFPGCHQTHHLNAHHLKPWEQGGSTDLTNLVLLCRRHHTFVHEGGLRISPIDRSPGRFQFAWPDGQPISNSWRSGLPFDSVEEVLRRYLPEPTTPADQARSANPANPVNEIAPPGGGAGFSLAECVRVLFGLHLDPRAAPTSGSTAEPRLPSASSDEGASLAA